MSRMLHPYTPLRNDHFQVNQLQCCSSFYPATWPDTTHTLPHTHSFQPAQHTTRYHSPHRYIAVAVQVVYIGPAKLRVPMVARVCLANYRGDVVLDTFVRPTQPVTDYRTAQTGLQFAHLMNAPFFQHVQAQVAAMIKNKILVGHAIWSFLSVMGLSHPTVDTRDVALFVSFQRTLQVKGVVDLHVLVERFMGRHLGLGYEHPLERARASLDLFRSCEELWERIVHSGAWPCTLPPSNHAECFT